jgi:peroxiredoxin
MKTVFAIAAAVISTSVLASATPGSPAPGFTLTDLSGKPVNLADYKGKTVVLEWHNFACPFVQKHYRSGNMQSLQKKYGSDVVWLAVNSTAL